MTPFSRHVTHHHVGVTTSVLDSPARTLNERKTLDENDENAWRLI